MYKKTQFKYFLSDADVEQYQMYQLGLSSALKRFAVDGVVLTTIEKVIKEEVYVICAVDSKNQVIGGIRLEIKTPNSLIPLEKCSVSQKHIILSKVKSFSEQQKSIGEICGLWMSPDYKGGGIGRRLALEATQLGLGLGLSVLVSMLPEHTLKYFTSLGFVPDPDIRPMAYPDDRYISTVVFYMNPVKTQQVVTEPITFQDSASS
jgi:hypothetical protein